MDFQTQHLIISRLTISDWPLFESLHTEPSVIERCFDMPNTPEIKSRFESRLQDWSEYSDFWLCLVIRERVSGSPVGVTGLKLVGQVAEVGYLLLPQFHGKGYGTESLQAFVSNISARYPIHRYKAVVTAGNIGSERVLEKCGFKRTKTIKDAHTISNQLYDDHIFELLL